MTWYIEVNIVNQDENLEPGIVPEKSLPATLQPLHTRFVMGCMIFFFHYPFFRKKLSWFGIFFSGFLSTYIPCNRFEYGSEGDSPQSARCTLTA